MNRATLAAMREQCGKTEILPATAFVELAKLKRNTLMPLDVYDEVAIENEQLKARLKKLEKG